MIFEENVLKLCDFGISRETNHSLTMSSLKGTYKLMAPELFNADDVKKAPFSKFSDIYSYGMLVLQIHTRRIPFSGLKDPYVALNVGNGTLQPKIPLDCPQDLADLMRQCWNMNPRKRPTMDEIVDKLLEEEEPMEVNLEMSAEVEQGKHSSCIRLILDRPRKLLIATCIN